MPPVYMSQLFGSLFLEKLFALSIKVAAEAFDNYAFYILWDITYILWDITCVDASAHYNFIVKSTFRFKYFSPLQESIDVIHQSSSSKES